MPHKRFTTSALKGYVLSLGIVCLFLFSGATVQAATLSVTPLTSSVTVGNIVSVKVVIGTQGKNINNSEGTILFPSDMLDVLSLSKTPSVFSLWVEEPHFSNVTGKINFNGGVPNPGFIGESGEVISITFKAKKAGTASIVFSDATIRENNGLGTDILTSKQPAVISIGPGQNETLLPVVPSSQLPSIPVVTSITHPSSDQWYSHESATFSWVVPNNITSLQTLFGKSAYSTPTVTYDGSVSQKTITNLSDGVSYFHLRYMNNLGWGPTVHYKIQVDSTPPEKFTLAVQDNGIRNVVSLNATDTISGIDSYSLKIDDGATLRVKNETLTKNKYTLPIQEEGDHELVVVAYDKAGNYTESRTLFSSPAIIAPQLSVVTDHPVKNSPIEIKGKSEYPHTNVSVFIKNSRGNESLHSAVTSDDGSFSVITSAIDSSGTTVAWAQLMFSENVKSPFSEKITFEVYDTSFVKAAKSITYGLSLIIPIGILIFILLILLYMGWHKFFGLKRKILNDFRSTADDIHKALMLFKDELGTQLESLKKVKEERVLNKKEEKIFKELQNNIDNIDEFIAKKLRKLK
jgi:hypothetical protein